MDLGSKLRAGFVGECTINRRDFGVSWNAPLEHDGIVVGDEIQILVDAEAIREGNE